MNIKIKNLPPKEAAGEIRRIPFYVGWDKVLCYDSFKQKVQYTYSDEYVYNISKVEVGQPIGTCYNEDAAHNIIIDVLLKEAEDIALWLRSEQEHLRLLFRSSDNVVGYVYNREEKLHTCDAYVVLRKCDNEVGFYVTSVRPVIIGV